MKMRRIGPSGTNQTVSVPRHRSIDRGTLYAIYKRARRFVPERDLRPHFYRD